MGAVLSSPGGCETSVDQTAVNLASGLEEALVRWSLKSTNISASVSGNASKSRFQKWPRLLVGQNVVTPFHHSVKSTNVLHKGYGT